MKIKYFLACLGICAVFIFYGVNNAIIISKRGGAGPTDSWLSIGLPLIIAATIFLFLAFRCQKKE